MTQIQREGSKIEADDSEGEISQLNATSQLNCGDK
jgi:hypothetical protein